MIWIIYIMKRFITIWFQFGTIQLDLAWPQYDTI